MNIALVATVFLVVAEGGCLGWAVSRLWDRGAEANETMERMIAEDAERRTAFFHLQGVGKVICLLRFNVV